MRDVDPDNRSTYEKLAGEHKSLLAAKSIAGHPSPLRLWSILRIEAGSRVVFCVDGVGPCVEFSGIVAACREFDIRVREMGGTL